MTAFAVVKQRIRKSVDFIASTSSFLRAPRSSESKATVETRETDDVDVQVVGDDLQLINLISKQVCCLLNAGD